MEGKLNYLLEVMNVVTNKRPIVHGRRLKFFFNKDYDVTEEVKEHFSYQEGELLLIEFFEDICQIEGQIELQVKWRVFDATENAWLQLETLREDVPDLLKESLEETVKTGTTRERTLAQCCL